MLLSIAIALPGLAIVSPEPVQSAQPARVLQDALKQAFELRGQNKTGEISTILQSAAKTAAASIDADSDAGVTLAAAMREAMSMPDPVASNARLYNGINETIVALSFKPIIEAPLPLGFPEPGPVGVVVVKEYPAYRAARSSMRTGWTGQNSAFNNLFRHITSNDVKMTAPVEMTYDSSNGSNALSNPATMMFLYERPDQGTTGAAGAVEVVDFPAVTVISIGIRGVDTIEKRRDAIKRLEAYLESNVDRLERAGEVRYMGYNSPFVLPTMRFAEIQIPVRKK
jgi:hypothetical protein